jgi:hypothetical protein
VSIYFLLLDAEFFHQQVCPTLSACWQQRSFRPCRALSAALEPAVQTFAQRYHTGAKDTLLARAGSGLAFDRDTWRALAGEILLYGAMAIPEIQTAPDTLACLLAPDLYQRRQGNRPTCAPIVEAHYGARDLVFGHGYYRPDEAGWNDVNDVARLASYLEGIDPGKWTVADVGLLRGISDEEERADELEFAREWFPELAALYKQAHENHQIIVCEIIGTARLD